MSQYEQYNLEKQLTSFLKKVMEKKNPDVNNIIVTSKELTYGRFSYSIWINPSFDGARKMNKDPEFEKRLLNDAKYLTQMAISMFKKDNIGHYIETIDWFWD